MEEESGREKGKKQLERESDAIVTCLLLLPAQPLSQQTDCSDTHLFTIQTLSLSLSHFSLMEQYRH